MRPFAILDRALTLQTPVTPARYIAFVGRLIVLYVGTGIVGGLLAFLAATAYALASAPQIVPDAPRAHGCPVILPEPGDGHTAALEVRTIHPLSECDDSALVSFGASVRDNAGGRR